MAPLSDDDKKKMNELRAAAIESAHYELYAANPTQSYVTEDWIKADPFWKPKSGAMAAPKAAATEKSRRHSLGFQRPGVGNLRLFANGFGFPGAVLVFLQSHRAQPSSNGERRGLDCMTIFIPTPLRPYAAGMGAIEIDAPTIADGLKTLTESHPDLRRHLFTPEGKIRAFVNLYLNDEDVRYLSAREATAVTSGDTLSIIPSIAGG